METKNMIGKVVGITVALICVAVILMPVLSDATATEKTFTNEGAFYVEADPSDTYTIEYDKATEPGVIYVNDVALNVSFSSSYTLFAIDNAILRTISDNTIQYKGDGSYIVGISSLDITIANGSISGTYTGVGGNATAWPDTTYTELHIASPTVQDYVMTAYNTTSKMNGDSEIFAFGQTSVNAVPYLFKITGNIDDGVTVACLDKTTGEEVEGAVISNLAINKTAVSGYLDLYDLTSITFTVTLADTSTANCTYTAYIIPAEVTAELAQHLDSGQIAIVGAIPVMIIVAIVLMAVGFVTSRRD